jgi:hypothetical protein
MRVSGTGAESRREGWAQKEECERAGGRRWYEAAFNSNSVGGGSVGTTAAPAGGEGDSSGACCRAKLVVGWGAS